MQSIKNYSMKDISKIIRRKFKKIEYRHIDLIPGYEKAENEYKKLRSSVLDVENIIKELSNYEHGSNIYKNIKRGIQYLNDKVSLGIYKNRDMYEYISSVGKDVSTINSNREYKSIGDKYSEVFKEVSESKKNFNMRLKHLKNELQEIKNKLSELDEERKLVRDRRFDLEVLLQDGGYNDEIKDIQQKDYEEASKSSLKNMINFTEKNEMSNILKNIAKEYKRHNEDVSNLLSRIN